MDLASTSAELSAGYISEGFLRERDWNFNGVSCCFI